MGQARESAQTFQIGQVAIDRLVHLDSLHDFVPGIGRPGSFGILFERGAELGFIGSLLIHDGFIPQSGFVAGDGFLRVLQAENVLLRDTGVLFGFFAEILQHFDTARVVLQGGWILHVAQELQLSHGEKPPGIAGMP